MNRQQFIDYVQKNTTRSRIIRGKSFPITRSSGIRTMINGMPSSWTFLPKK